MRIALIGKMRSGKDTAGDYLINKYDCKRFAFGDGIREIVDRLFPEVAAEGKPRHHLQFIGQALRELDNDVWVKYLLKKVANYEQELSQLQQCPVNIVITDTRQKNEVDKLREHGYTIIKITCPDGIRLRRMKSLGDIVSAADLEHDTEKQVDMSIADYEIINDGTLEELYTKVDNIVEKLQEDLNG